MRKRVLGILVAGLVLASPALAETIHLKSGESIQGRIIGMDENTVSVESERGYGVLQISREDILLIEYTDERRDPSRKFGVGYHQRSAPLVGSGTTADYALDHLSLKYWLDRYDSLDLLFGFFNATNDGTTELQIFSLQARYAHVFRRQANLDLYYGAGVGYLDVEDRTGGRDVNDTGSTLQLFLGAELFFVTLPDLGISAEVGIGTQTVGERTVTSISSTTFPAFSVRYYF